jgi:hypothetical protein
MTTGGWIMAILGMVIIFALIAGTLYWLVASGTGNTTSQQTPTAEATPREILDRRLAKGELSLEEHKQLRETIDDESPADASRPGRGQPQLRSQPADTPDWKMPGAVASVRHPVGAGRS